MEHNEKKHLLNCHWWQREKFNKQVVQFGISLLSLYFMHILAKFNIFPRC